jgi:imidazolonepropionase-like amidohydrolase
MSAFLIDRARVFNGARLIEQADVLVEDQRIVAIARSLRADEGVRIVDGQGKTLLPGLIDAHVHVRPPGLAEQAIAFGVTTVLDMGSEPALMLPYRERAEQRNDIADIRSSSAAVTPPGGHPSPLVGLLFEQTLPGLEDVAHAPDFVHARIAERADYIKLVIEDGAMFGTSLPALSEEQTEAVVRVAHAQGKLAVAHAHTQAAAWQAVRAGVDGLAHLFIDSPPEQALIAEIAERDIFVTPTLTLLEAMVGRRTGAGLADDGRVRELLSKEWIANLRRAWRFDCPGDSEHAVEAVARLYAAGVRILAGTDAACLGIVGTAPGPSLHRELELLVDAGLTESEAIAAATSVPADCFGLHDRGRIAPGLQADLVLVDGDPTTDISDSLSIEAVWRRGERLDREASSRGSRGPAGAR